MENLKFWNHKNLSIAPFEVTESYFLQFGKELNLRLDLELGHEANVEPSLPKSLPFQVPHGYFQSFSVKQKLFNNTDIGKASKEKTLHKTWLMAAMILISLGMSVSIMKQIYKQETTKELTLSGIEWYLDQLSDREHHAVQDQLLASEPGLASPGWVENLDYIPNDLDLTEEDYENLIQ